MVSVMASRNCGNSSTPKDIETKITPGVINKRVAAEPALIRRSFFFFFVTARERHDVTRFLIKYASRAAHLAEPEGFGRWEKGTEL